MIEAQPGMTYRPLIFMKIAHSANRKPSPAEPMPMKVATCSGIVENEMIPSSASRAILRRGYLVSPAWRGSRW